MIEQATFAYSPLEKSFEKQTKTIEDQVEKQIESLEEHGKQLIKSSGEKDSLELLKQKETFDEFVNERMFEINKLSEEIDFNNSTYHCTSKNAQKMVYDATYKSIHGEGLKILTLIRLGFSRVIFSQGRVNLTPFLFQEELI